MKKIFWISNRSAPKSCDNGDLHDNAVKISPSNGDSADLVARGEFAFSLVDSDDVVNRMKQNQPVDLVYPDQGDGRTALQRRQSSPLAKRSLASPISVLLRAPIGSGDQER